LSGQAGALRLEARSLEFSYAAPVVRDFSLRIRAGTMTGIIGPNGCGKTTVLRLLSGILKPSSGEVVLHPVGPVAGMKRREIARHMAMVPQETAGPLPQKVLEFVLQGRAPHLSFMGFESERDEEIACEALEQTRLSDLAEAQASALSGGEKQRLLLARALAQESPILLLDELTANLDINFQVELMRLVARVTREKNLATLVVSHEINLLASFVDSVVLMAGGSILHHGPAAAVITERNLAELFGMGFTVRSLPGGTPEVLPVISRS